PPAARRVVRAADRDAGARHARPPRRGLHRGGARHRGGAAARLRRTARRAGRAHRGDRRALPAVRDGGRLGPAERAAVDTSDAVLAFALAAAVSATATPGIAALARRAGAIDH